MNFEKRSVDSRSGYLYSCYRHLERQACPDHRVSQHHGFKSAHKDRIFSELLSCSNIAIIDCSIFTMALPTSVRTRGRSTRGLCSCTQLRYLMCSIFVRSRPKRTSSKKRHPMKVRYYKRYVEFRRRSFNNVSKPGRLFRDGNTLSLGDLNQPSALWPITAVQ